MKIAYVYDNVYPYYIGGLEKRVWEVARRLAQRGHDVHWYAMKYWDGPDVLEKEGVYLHGVCEPKPLFVHGRRSVEEAIYFARNVFIPLARDNYDIIDCQNFPYFPCFSAKIASLLKKTPLVITWHEVWDTYWYTYLGKKGVFGKAVERITACLTDHNVAVSPKTKNDLQSIGVDKEITVIPNGIDFDSIQAITPSPEKTDVIYAGRLIKEKNIDMLIKAIELVKKELPDVQCTIIGEGPEKEALRTLTLELNLERNIRIKDFVTSQDDLFALMKSARVFVLPSVREGFGISVLEANACGLPVVTVEHSQNAAYSLIKNGENGFIAKLNVEDLTIHICKALYNTDAKEFTIISYSKKYDWNNVISLLERRYHEISN